MVNDLKQHDTQSKVNRENCHYNSCQLPQNNKKYLAQMIYLILALFLMLPNDQFSFTTIFMFVVPIILDIEAMPTPDMIIKLVKYVFYFINMIIGLFCFLGFFGIIINQDEFFITSTNLIMFNNIIIPKSIIFYILLSDIIFPIILFFCSPCQSKNEIVTAFENFASRGDVK